jgi:hypothetical protein
MAPYWGTPPKLLLARAAKHKPFAPELIEPSNARLPPSTRIFENRRQRRKKHLVISDKPCDELRLLFSI